LKPLLAGLLALALAGTAAAQDRGGGHEGYGQRGGYANPSAVIAAELAFARLAQDKGQWTAFKATAAPDAVLFAPAMVLAQPWLKDRPNPPQARSWQPSQVWSSCDGSVMVATGGWQRGERHGWFTTVWQRQPKGGYKWVFEHDGETRLPAEAPDMIAAKVADCPNRRPGGQAARRHKPKKPAKAPPAPFDPGHRQGRSTDGTLTWQVTADATGAHTFTARLMVDGQMREIRREQVPAG
jgi:hypothetical protein